MDANIHALGGFSFKRIDPISCKVNGKKLTCRIVGLTTDPVQIGFGLKFSDGVVFETGSNPMVLMEDFDDDSNEVVNIEKIYDSDEDFIVSNPKHIPYLQAMKEHLNSFLLVMDSDWYQFTIIDQKKELVVWVAYRDLDKDFPYSVCFNGDYQFSLGRENRVWKSKSVRIIDPHPINPAIVEMVTNELESRI